MSRTESAFAAALSQQPDTEAAVSDVACEALARLAVQPNLAVVFFSAHHAPQAQAIASGLADQLGTECLLGCSGESVLGGELEIEAEPAVSLWITHQPASTFVPVRLEFARTAGGGTIVGWPDELREDWPDNSALLMFGDPFSFPADFLLERAHQEHPGIPIIGGMASAAQEPGGNRLIVGREVYTDGAVALRMHGQTQLRTIVSQGCRPIGEPFVVTQAERNVIHQLGGVSAYRRLQEVYASLATSEQRMVQKGLHLGRVVSEYQDHFEQGDFLVRNVVGVDSEEGSIAVGDYVKVGQTVQFHLRDAHTADAELRQLLAAAKSSPSSPRGALLFTCNGRGTRLFTEPHHDASAVQQAFESLPLAGFFAAGELGPIGGQNFVHGFTASIALWE